MIRFLSGGGVAPTGTAVEADVLTGKTFSNALGISKNGAMPENGNVIKTITAADQVLPAGHYSGLTFKGDADLVPANIMSGVQIGDVTGTHTDNPSSTGDAVPANVLAPHTFSNGSNTGLTGTMTDNGAVTITPGAASQPIPAGYHNGSGNVPAVSFDASKVLTGTTIAGTAGTMANRGAVTITPGATDQAISAGYHNGSGKVSGDANLIAANIMSGKSIFGVAGSGNIIKSIQRGTTTVTAGATNNYTINSVNVSNCVIMNNILPTTTANSNPLNDFGYPTLTSSTNLQIINSTGYNLTFNWTVIEFQNIKSLQTGVTSMATNINTISATFSNVDTTKALLFYNLGGNGASGSSPWDISSIFVAGYIASGTSANFSKLSTTQKVGFNIQWFVVEFN